MEHGRALPGGKNRASYEKHSQHKFAGNLAKYKTPMLVIHNDLDFRGVRSSEGIQLFTTLGNARGVAVADSSTSPTRGHWGC